jgi:hypothetical protein
MMNLGYWGFLMFAFAAGATLVFGVYLAWEAYMEPKGKAMHMQSFLLAPTRPGRALRALAYVKLPVG